MFGPIDFLTLFDQHSIAEPSAHLSIQREGVYGNTQKVS